MPLLQTVLAVAGGSAGLFFGVLAAPLVGWAGLIAARRIGQYFLGTKFTRETVAIAAELLGWVVGGAVILIFAGILERLSLVEWFACGAVMLPFCAAVGLLLHYSRRSRANPEGRSPER